VCVVGLCVYCARTGVCRVWENFRFGPIEWCKVVGEKLGTGRGG
jgi:hypothetical protein